MLNARFLLLIHFFSWCQFESYGIMFSVDVTSFRLYLYVTDLNFDKTTSIYLSFTVLQVVVHVKNELFERGITIHWHGLPQRFNAWMDGVPELTQCAIPAGHSFTYRFNATPAGTFWYHSHAAYQRTEGIAGNVSILATPYLYSKA